MTLTAHPLVFAMRLHECHESQPSNFPCSNTWATHEDHHTLPNIVLQLFLGAEMALQTLCGPWLSGPSCSSQASRKLFDLVWSILKHFREWEKTWFIGISVWHFLIFQQCYCSYQHVVMDPQTHLCNIAFDAIETGLCIKEFGLMEMTYVMLSVQS